jgi:methanogenic corrinoid protein MtbC1
VIDNYGGRIVNELLNDFEQALLAVDAVAAREVFDRWGAENVRSEFLDQIIVPVLDKIGDSWAEGSVSLAQVYMSGRICEKLVDAIIPQDAMPVRSHPRIAIVVLEDRHILGKTIVYSFLRSCGFSLLDYGCLGVDDTVKRAIDDKIEVLLVSTLMLPSALRVKDLRKQFDARHADVKIVVGGAPFRFDETLWKEVGAYAMGRRAFDAISVFAGIEGGAS